MKKHGKIISILGAPSSGKSTLASEVHVNLKKRGLNSIFISEVATEYIAEYGIPSTPIDQMVIFYKQLNKEKTFLDSKDYIVCDSSPILNYFYFRNLFPHKPTQKDIATINHLQKEILKYLDYIGQIFYVPPYLDGNVDDGVRYHKKDDIIRIDRWVKSYLEIENINHQDISDVEMDKRTEHIISKIL